MDLVSVIMPVYNNQKYLKEAIESVQNIDYDNLEIIIIDDCSQDNSFAICSQSAASDSRIRFLKHDVNKGAPQALKTGVKFSKGKYIVGAAGDDISLPCRVKECVDTFKSKPSVGMIVSNAIIINEDSQETGEVYEVDPYIINENIAINQFKRNYCLGATMAFINDKNILLKNNMFQFLDDYEVSLEYLINNYDIAILKKYLIKYRIHSNNYSNNNSILRNKTKMLLSTFNLSDIESNLKSRGFSEKNILVTLGIIELFKEEYLFGYDLLKKASFINDNSNERILFENNFYLGVASYNLGYYEESFNYFNNALQINNNEPTILNNFGVISYLVNNDVDSALLLIYKSLKINNKYIDALNNINKLKEQRTDFKITPRILAETNIKRVCYNI